jgi:hypothetical protein
LLYVVDDKRLQVDLSQHKECDNVEVKEWTQTTRLQAVRYAESGSLATALKSEKKEQFKESTGRVLFAHL